MLHDRGSGSRRFVTRTRRWRRWRVIVVMARRIVVDTRRVRHARRPVVRRRLTSRALRSVLRVRCTARGLGIRPVHSRIVRFRFNHGIPAQLVPASANRFIGQLLVDVAYVAVIVRGQVVRIVITARPVRPRSGPFVRPRDRVIKVIRRPVNRFNQTSVTSM